VLVLVTCACAGGCSTYLHDDALQAKTDALVSNYSGAKLADAVNAIATAQQARDDAAIKVATTRASAERDARLAGLMLGTGDRTSLALLADYVQSRKIELAGQFRIDPAISYSRKLDARVMQRATLASLQAEAAHLSASYSALGGKGFSDCDTFRAPVDPRPDVKILADRLTLLCLDVNKAQSGVRQADADLTVPGGQIGLAHQWAKETLALINRERDNEAIATKSLNDAKRQVDAAAADASPDAGARFVAALGDLGKTLGEVDEAAGLFGAKSPGAALASVKFRNTNLCDLISAEAGTSCDGGTPTANAKQVTAGIANVITGAQDAMAPPAPGTMSLMLAYQNTVGNLARTRLDALQLRLALLDDEETHLLIELGQLQIVEKEIDTARKAGAPDACLNAGFADALTQHEADCPPAYRRAVARALVALTASLSRGKAVASIDQLKVAQLDYRVNLQLAQQVASARTSALTTAINEIGAYGQGGLKADTVAQFLQAFGIAAIAAK